MDPLHHTTSEFSSQSHGFEQDTAMASAGISKEKHKKLFQRGMLWLAGGVALMGLSFCVNYCLFHADQSFTGIMYTMTTLGAVCMTKGMADILGF